MTEKVIIGIVENNKVIRTTEVTPETPIQHNKHISSIYARVRVGENRVGTRFIPDVNFANGKLYKSLALENGLLVPVCNNDIHHQMLELTK